MKNKKVPSLFVCSLFLCFGTLSYGSASEYEDVMTLTETFADAVSSSNADDIAEFLSDRHIHVNPFGVRLKGADFLNDIREGRLHFDFYNIESLEAIPVSSGMYLMIGVAQACAHREGKEMSGRFRFVHVLRREFSKWHSIYAQHTRIVVPGGSGNELQAFIDP